MNDISETIAKVPRQMMTTGTPYGFMISPKVPSNTVVMSIVFPLLFHTVPPAGVVIPPGMPMLGVYATWINYLSMNT